MVDQPGSLDTTEEQAWRAMMLAHHQLTGRLRRDMFRECGISLPDYEVLAALFDRPDVPPSLGTLATALRWEKSRLSHQIHRMSRRGLLERICNPADGRSSLIGLSATGRDTFERAAPAYARLIRQHLLDQLTPQETNTLRTVHDRLVQHLDHTTDTHHALH